MIIENLLFCGRGTNWSPYICEPELQQMLAIEIGHFQDRRTSQFRLQR